MKKKVVLFSLFLSCAALAQNTSITGKGSGGDHSQKGFYIGFDYMNLTDVHSKIIFSSDAGKADYEENGTHLGTAGIRLGYNSTPESGFGYEAGARFLENFNKSEYGGGDNKLYMIIPEVNATFAANRFLVGYIGINAAIFNGSTAAEQYKTDVGGQLGLGFRFTKELALNAGYTILRQRASLTNSSFDADVEYQIGGFNSNLTYTF